MKVLEKGREQKGWSKECKCTGNGNGGGGCGAKLLVEEADLYRTSHHSYDGSSEHYITFECCECGVETDIGGVPSKVEENIGSKRKKVTA